ncbi:hypothetical protein CBR_g25738 [Chara braunii]|uniref:Reverse transcriptase domain-containing protein n=1 Tax=Chara braunii TaxID=69332 RepID=A0A388L681_CHABU|nr:hypothetical protein CBR_g25738 [Chara braunii]|eukprot:GBG77807.1 hypothetical protein CBR_g25738 [Chara braunii]
MEKIRAVTWNVRGLWDTNGRMKRRRLKSWLHEWKVNCVFLQESKLNETKLKEFEMWWDGPQVWSPAQGSRGGVGFLLHRDLQAHMIDTKADIWGKWAWMKVEIGGEAWVLMTVYAPTVVSERVKFIARLMMHVPKTDRLLLAGDWNVSLDEALRPNSRTAERNDVKTLMEFCTELSLTDPFLILNPEEPGYSWFSNLHRDRQTITRRRLDFYLLSEQVMENIIMTKEVSHPMSDHKPVVLDIRIRIGIERGRGFFRLNSQVLEAPGIMEWVENHMKGWKEARQHFESSAEWLDGGLAITSGVLDKQMIELRHPFDDSAPTACTAVGMLRYANLYYEDILRTRRPNEDVNTYLSQQSDMWEDTKVRLGTVAKLDMDRPVTLKELTQTLKSMVRGKSPGVDGLTVEFYSANWGVIGPLLVELYNEGLIGGRLGKGMTHGVITVLFKKGDKYEVRNWRPISLLNVSYKILAKMLARRLSKHLPQLVERDQGAFVQGRSIFNNIVTAIKTLEIVQSEGLDTAVLLLDLEKAYDKVSWTFVLTTLKKMGFGTGFCSWMKVMYMRSSSAVMINGHLSKPFQLSRSLRQGCPLAPLVFVLQMEVLLNRVRRNPDIRGLSLHNGEKCKVKALADDLFAVSDNTPSSLLALKGILREYSTLSEASVSTYFLPDQFSLSVEWGMRRVERGEEERFLGVLISLQVESSTEGLVLQQRIATRLNMWGSAWHLSLIGRALVANIALFSILWFVSTVKELVVGVLKAIRRLVARFLWKPRAKSTEGFISKVALDTLTFPREKGGLGLVDPIKKNQAQLWGWLAKAANCSTREQWMTLAERILMKEWGLSRPKDVWTCFLMPSFREKRLKSVFWEAVRKAWKQHPPDVQIPPATRDEVLNQLVLDNAEIQDSSETCW